MNVGIFTSMIFFKTFERQIFCLMVQSFQMKGIMNFQIVLSKQNNIFSNSPRIFKCLVLIYKWISV